MENITEDYVSFETAKLLKEKGFHSIRTNDSYIYPEGFLGNRSSANLGGDREFIARPTQALILKWLRVVHSVHICIHAQDNRQFNFEINNWSWYEPEQCERVGTIILGETFWHTTSTLFPSPEEATEAAIQYFLNNLIK